MDEIKIGMKLGYWTIIDARDQGIRRQSWWCECVCGKRRSVGRISLLGIGSTKALQSCGCKKESQGGILKTDEAKRLYNTWYEMNKRCHNTKADNYDRYGGAGVTVCDEWRESFLAFYDWAYENGYEDDLTIDRIDSEKPYSPYNCRWATYYTQMQNRGLMGNNKTGVNGVTYSEEHGYRVYITRDKVRKYLGKYETLESAKVARSNADDYYNKYGTIVDYKYK